MSALPIPAIRRAPCFHFFSSSLMEKHPAQIPPPAGEEIFMRWPAERRRRRMLAVPGNSRTIRMMQYDHIVVGAAVANRLSADARNRVLSWIPGARSRAHRLTLDAVCLIFPLLKALPDGNCRNIVMLSRAGRR
jgi:hypothetical protein